MVEEILQKMYIRSTRAKCNGYLVRLFTVNRSKSSPCLGDVSNYTVYIENRRRNKQSPSETLKFVTFVDIAVAIRLTD